mmetsp:Transcript_118861/g.380808  ORF Transcript_118861/g.380808 Transcript_118861/m.380808 type:complete len:201 (+) Transcript_118861:57-659(+)
MDRQERVLVHRSLGCLVRSLRQWEAADAVASRELEKCVNGLARAEYLAPEHAGLLGFAGLNAESLALARAASYAQGSPLMHRVMELLEGEMDATRESLASARADLGEGAEFPFAGHSQLGSAAALRGALRMAIEALGSEIALRRSLLAALSEVRPSDQDELRRLLIVWNERPFSAAGEGSRIERLQRLASDSLETLTTAR